MRVLISGATGMVGSAVSAALQEAGHTVLALVRPQTSGKTSGESAVRWDPVAGQFDAAAAEGADAVVHLAGASIAGGRWSAARKQVLRSSRVDATQHLVNALGKLARRPKVFVAASAIGYYGNRGDEVLTEQSAPANDFLGALSQEWEAASRGAEKFGAHVVLLRFGVILAAHGGALGKMLLPFRLGLGGVIGTGRQWMSWISLPDVVALVLHALANDGLRGPVNAVAPNVVTNAEFAKTLGKVLGRPTIFPMPAFAARLAFGEMADALLLASQRVHPARLQEGRYPFQYATLEAALRAVLARG